MNENVIVIGAGGHGKVIADIIKKSGDMVSGFLDDNPSLSDTFMGYPILGSTDVFEDFKKCQFVIAIGDAVIREKNNREARWCEMVYSDSSFICDFGHRGIYWRRNCYYGKRGNQYGNNNWKALHY